MEDKSKEREQKRATRRTIRSLHDAINNNDIEKVKDLLTPDVDVNFHYGGHSALQIAVTKGYEDICHLLISHGADVNKYNADDSSLLHMAVRRGHTNISQLLLDKGADPDMCNDHGSSPLNTAAYFNHSDIATRLVKAGCTVDRPDNRGQSPVITAAKEGNLEVVKVLIDGKCDINWTNYEKKTALITAAEQGHDGVVQELVKANCDLNAHENYSCTALLLAARAGHLPVVNILIDAGADVNKADSGRYTPVLGAVKEQHLGVVKALAAAKCNVNIAERENQQTAIHAAVRIATQYFGPKDVYTDLVETLIHAGSDLSLRDRSGWTPLYQAAFAGEVDICNLLLEHNAPVDRKTDTGNTVLHGAAFGNQPVITANLIKAGCPVNVANNKNELPLYTAVDHRAHIDIIKQFLEAGSKTNEQETKHGQTPLFPAIQHDYTEAVELLIEAGSDAGLTNFSGNTPLWLACDKGNESIVKILLRQPGIDVNAGLIETPLLSAAVPGHYDIVDMLLKAGADVNKMNDMCMTPLFQAAYNNHLAVANLLVKSGANPSAPSLAKLPKRCCKYYRDKHPHLETEPLYAAVKNDNFQMIKLILMATSRTPYKVITTLRDLIFRTGFAQEARLSQQTIYKYAKFFAAVLSTPNTLQRECRGVVKNCLGVDFASKVPDLPLPNKLKDFLLYKDVLKPSQEE